MHLGVPGAAVPSALLFSSFFLASISNLILWAEIPQVAAAPASMPHLVGSSPFANRMQAEANAVAVTCRLLLPQHTPSPRIAAFVLNDISGGLEYSLRQFCSFKADKPPGVTVHVAAFSSRGAMRTSLLLQRLSRLPLSSPRAVGTQRQLLSTGASCCRPSSDLDELSFAATNCECSFDDEPVNPLPPSPLPPHARASSHNRTHRLYPT